MFLQKFKMPRNERFGWSAIDLYDRSSLREFEWWLEAAAGLGMILVHAKALFLLLLQGGNRPPLEEPKCQWFFCGWKNMSQVVFLM